MVCYCDSSALFKLFVDEPGSASLRRLLSGGVDLVSSTILRVEVLRALARRGGVDDSEPAEAFLDSMAFVVLSDSILRRAAALRPVALRTLDSLHLASALELSPPPDAFLCYDDRLGGAARQHGLRVLAPGDDEVHER